MAGMCCGVVGETETSVMVEQGSRAARRRRTEIHQLKFLASEDVPENGRKRQKLEIVSAPREGGNLVENSAISGGVVVEKGGSVAAKPVNRCESRSLRIEREAVRERPNFGMTSVCGRRRDMEDAVAIHRSFCRRNDRSPADLHFFGVYDGHGCSHVAMKCRDRMHEIVRDEVQNCEEAPWTQIMERSFSVMDEEVTNWSSGGVKSSNCRCELQTPQCDAVGSTAVVAVVTPEKIVVSNCGDSRAVLCRNGVAIPLSSDHKPDRPDELNRIETAGGRVIYWDGPRVLGVLAMSRAIGDNYLKPFVIPEPEVTVTDRTADDEFLILASDGLWDVVSNETACGVARMCLQSPGSEVNFSSGGDTSDEACSDASILLTKLALARHSTDNVSVVVVDLKRDL
ncbi:protein phosphatase 2C 37-like [Actinidia eriantha]|uniref:protein phosphatase 2C 37-like n=1 Tax=Actinidia eriantha TaxID=165200 RepID=UPI0025854721|nr:protein phosphatase 2C 37-like [Actinidia eriantha]